MRKWIVLVVIGIAGLAGCYAAPPIGIGAGAHTRSSLDGTVTASTGAAAASERDSFQIDGGFAIRKRPWYTIEYAAVYTQHNIRTEDGRRVRVFGFFPYLRPKMSAGPFSLATALSLLGGSGGEVGSLGVFADVQLGVGGDWWSAYAGGYGLGYANNATGDGQTFAAQARVGGEMLADVPGGRLGLAVEVYRQIESIENFGYAPYESSFFGLGVKLRLELGGPDHLRHEWAMASRAR